MRTTNKKMIGGKMQIIEQSEKFKERLIYSKG